MSRMYAPFVPRRGTETSRSRPGPYCFATSSCAPASPRSSLTLLNLPTSTLSAERLLRARYSFRRSSRAAISSLLVAVVRRFAAAVVDVLDRLDVGVLQLVVEDQLGQAQVVE